MFGAREPASTIKFVDDYCQWYRKLFPEVRSFEAFKYLHVGMISDIKRKTLPAISRIVGLSNEQGLLHFLTESPWKLEQLRLARLRLILQVLAGREITLIIDETGDRKKGSTTDYVKRQYIGNLGKIENGIVAVTAYGLLEGMTFPLVFEVYKPKERLLEGDTYLSKPKIAVEMIRYLQKLGFRPGRSCHDAIAAIFDSIRYKAKYVLDADIAKCFDRIDQEKLLKKLNTFPTMRRQIKSWLKSGVMDGKELFPTSEGTPQGGVISPLLANIALHGMETHIKQYVGSLKYLEKYNKNRMDSVSLIRYADDFVILHKDLTVVQRCQELISDW